MGFRGFMIELSGTLIKVFARVRTTMFMMIKKFCHPHVRSESSDPTRNRNSGFTVKAYSRTRHTVNLYRLFSKLWASLGCRLYIGTITDPQRPRHARKTRRNSQQACDEKSARKILKQKRSIGYCCVQKANSCECMAHAELRYAGAYDSDCLVSGQEGGLWRALLGIA